MHFFPRSLGLANFAFSVEIEVVVFITLELFYFVPLYEIYSQNISSKNLWNIGSIM